MTIIKILFLDFDGVLHPLNSNRENLFCNVHYLEKSLEVASCKIVITSNWRLTHSVDTMRELLPKKIGELIIGATDIAAAADHQRFVEIQSYLHTHIDSSPVDWRAIDDTPHDFPSECENLIYCDPYSGMSCREQILITQWLKS
jgi:HAD domain in Swiss Army Knife RNA repair proteins